MKTLKQFPRIFWVANTIELFERWAWYGLFNVMALYLTMSTSTGALGFTQQQKGLLMGLITAMVYFLPVFTGAISDKYGYRRSLIVAFVLYIVGFLSMSFVRDYKWVFLSFAIIGLGASIFKPIVSATIAKNTNQDNSSLGFGIFYMTINIGAFLGPIVSSKLRESNWHYVFYSSASAVFVALILVLFFYKEHNIQQNNEKLADNLRKIAQNIWSVVKDFKFLVFLLIIMGFWSIYFQLFYTLPVFIEQWFDTSVLYKSLENLSPFVAKKIGTASGTINPEMIINIDALYIFIFQIWISAFVQKLKPINTIITGFLVFSLGIGLTFMFNSAIFVVFALLIFSIGEMMSSPKITEYIGLLAPQDKKALYMGMSFLPIAGGNFFAGILSGNVYGAISDKTKLLTKYLESQNIVSSQISQNISLDEMIRLACQRLNITEQQLTAILWNTYKPQQIWIVFVLIGILTAVALYLYNKYIKNKK